MSPCTPVRPEGGAGCVNAPVQICAGAPRGNSGPYREGAASGKRLTSAYSKVLEFSPTGSPGGRNRMGPDRFATGFSHPGKDRLRMPLLLLLGALAIVAVATLVLVWQFADRRMRPMLTAGEAKSFKGRLDVAESERQELRRRIEQLETIAAEEPERTRF